MRPAGFVGWAVTIAAFLFTVQVFLAIDLHSHSVSDTLYGFYPFAGVTFLLWDWIARRLAGSAQDT